MTSTDHKRRGITSISSSSAVSRNSDNHYTIVGNRLSVDFANTACLQRGAGGLRNWDDLVNFLRATKLIEENRSISLQQLGKESPGETQELIRVALQLRDSLRQVLKAIAMHQGIDPSWVAPVNNVLRLTDGHDELQELVPSDLGTARWALQFVARERRLEWLLAAIARSAAEIISEGPDAPVRICANPQCGLFFYDTSRTGRRRWCSMAVCGNRHKVAEHARRQAAVSTDRKRREQSGGRRTKP